MPTLQPICPSCKNADFELFLLKDESVGAAKCVACDRHFLLLDSADYWFDVIQSGYPRVTRCACKNTAFRLELNYALREDGDVAAIKVGGKCTACKKARPLLRIEIDYSPTRKLLKQPLTLCKNPKILFDLHDVSLYATRADMVQLLEFVVHEGASYLVGSVREKEAWVDRQLDLASARQLLLSRSLTYQWIYASPRRLKLSATELETAKGEDRFWKRQELLRFSPPTQICFGSSLSKNGLLFYVNFANEYVNGGRVVAKSPAFRDLTTRFMSRLQEAFVAWRGVDCFDNPREHKRLFGSEFSARAKKTSR